MIDIVFQMLIFFVMSFQIATLEGDFHVRKPLRPNSAGPPRENFLPPLRVNLRADEAGELAAIEINGRSCGQSFDALRSQVFSFVGGETGAGSLAEEAEVELGFDRHLRYEYMVRAVETVSAFLDENRKVQPLIRRVRFTPVDGTSDGRP